MAKKILWQELRRSEFEQMAKADAVVVIPVGSTEQHGNHLPINTDACGGIKGGNIRRVEQGGVSKCSNHRTI